MWWNDLQFTPPYILDLWYFPPILTVALLWPMEQKQIWLKQRLDKFLCIGTCPLVALRALQTSCKSAWASMLDNERHRERLMSSQPCQTRPSYTSQHQSPPVDHRHTESAKPGSAQKNHTAEPNSNIQPAKSLSVMDQMFVSSWNSYVEVLTPHVAVLRDRAFTKVIKFKWGHKAFE